jgi:long-chain fatty acid transport protein
MNNPATLGFMKDGDLRLDIALGILAPDVDTQVTDHPFPISDGTSLLSSGSAASHGSAYYMPGLGVVKKFGKLATGFAVFAQGGMGTEYGNNSVLGNFLSCNEPFVQQRPCNPTNRRTNTITNIENLKLDQRSELGVGRAIVPVSYDVTEDLTIGGSVDFVWAGLDLKMMLTGEQFNDLLPLQGMGNTIGTVGGTLITKAYIPPFPFNHPRVNFAYFDFSDTSKFTGAANSVGWAGKLGFTYKINPQWNVGAVYHSRTRLGDLTTGDGSKTKLSFNVAGFGTIPLSGKLSIVDFQWPETYGLGTSFQATDRLQLVADWKHIGWAKVMKDFKVSFLADRSQDNGNAQTFVNFATGGGFGVLGPGSATLDATLFQNWKDQDVIMLGAAYKLTDPLTIRAGFNYARNPVPDSTLNALFPAIEKTHYTLGAG